MRTLPDGERPFVKSPEDFAGEYLQATLTILRIVEPPISRKDLLSRPELSKLSIFRQPNGTNFRVTNEEARVLEQIIRERENSTLRPRTSLNDLQEVTNLSIEELQEIEL